jgi:branched-chain amino acid transport system substrate-binding protein
VPPPAPATPTPPTPGAVVAPGVLPSAALPLPTAPKKSTRGLLVAGIALIVLILAGAGYFGYQYLQSQATPPAPPVKIGVLMDFTGSASSMGYGTTKGIQLAKKQLGADNIELVQMDSQCDKEVSPGAMQRLVDKQVVAVIGDGCSSASVAALEIANKNKVLMISPSASSPKLTIPDDYFFRVVPPDTFQGAFLAKTVFDKGHKTAAVFYTNEAYGQAMNSVFKEKFEALGGKVVASVFAESDVIDLRTQINTIKAAKPQAVVFVPNSIFSGAAAIKLARESGVTVPFYGGDGLYDRTLINNAKVASEGLIITSFPTGTKAFKQLLLAEYQGEELYAASQAYDAFEVLYRAINAGARTGEELKAKLPSISFDGVSGPIKFDKNGEISDPAYEYDLLQVKDGSFAAQ